MGFFSRETPNKKEVPVELKIQIDDADALYRIAEQNETVNQVIENYQTQVRMLHEQAQMGDGVLRPEDQAILDQDAENAASAMQSLGYTVDPAVFRSLED